MALDINKLTLGEVAKVEELSGMAISQIGEDDQPKGRALAALAFVGKRREDRSFTWDQAQELTFDEAQAILGLNTEQEGEQGEDPTQETQPSKQPSKAKSKK